MNRKTHDTKGEKYVIGADGGGTKTDMVLMSHQGYIKGRVQGGCSNYQAIGGEKLKIVLLMEIEKLIKVAQIQESQITRFLFGLAGAGRQSDREAVQALFDDTRYSGRIHIESDARVALAGAFGNRPGIILIAGTGAICFGMHADGQMERSGGWGYLLGDEGGGYYLGREAIVAALKDYDGRGEKTSLRSIIENRYDIRSIDTLIPMIYQEEIDRTDIAGLAPLVFQAAISGDSVAKLIVENSGRELGLLLQSVYVRMQNEGETLPVALIGSIFIQKEVLLPVLREGLGGIVSKLHFQDPEFDPALGAAMLALELADIPTTPEIREHMKASQ